MSYPKLFTDQYFVYAKLTREGKMSPRIQSDFLRVAIINHHRFVLGWIYNGASRDIFNWIYFIPVTGFQNHEDDARACAVNIKNFSTLSVCMISPRTLDFLESKGICFCKTDEYTNIKIRFLQELGT